MRVVSGEFRGRNLKAVPGNNTRPTTDKIKESIFNILGGYFDGGTMLDMYAGSGGIAIEAISRGMDHAYLFENNRQAIKTIEQNIAITKNADKFTVLQQNAKIGIQSLSRQQYFQRFKLVFLDPPYRLQEIVKDMEKLQDLDILADDVIVVAEVENSIQLPEVIGQLMLWKKVEYGITAVYFYEREELA